MNDLQYSWTRYWLPLGSTYYIDRSGFPSYHSYDTEQQKYTTDARTLTELNDIECVVLLGEPGTGKTTEIKNVVAEPGQKIVICKLGIRSTETDLLRHIEEMIVEAGVLENESLYLYLDGLDEAALNIPTIFYSLADWIFTLKEKYEPSDRLFDPVRLFIRISCRSAIWSTDIQNRLNLIFGENNVKVVEIAPLREVDLREVAKVNSLDADAFLKSILKADLENFATEPATIPFLTQAFSTGDMSQSKIPDKVRLYEMGCLQLCKEFNRSYARHKLGNEQRLRIASRIACCLILTNKSTILKSDDQKPEKEDLTLDGLINDSFKALTYSEHLTIPHVNEVLQTTLFTIKDSHRLVFKHKSYAEFLAAWHLNLIKVPPTTIRQLITSPISPDRSIPQIEQVLLWLCSMKKEMFPILIKGEPFILIRSQQTFTSEQRKEITDSILVQAKNALLLDRMDYMKFYSQLSHPGLPKQLLPYITNKKNNVVCRRIAIDIAAACDCKPIAKQLFKISADKAEDLHLRKRCVNALLSMDKLDLIDKLKGYALGNQADDVEDELKGVVLKSLYPGRISTSDMIVSLTKLKRRNLYGSYKAFLDEVGNKIPDADIGLAIKTLNTHPHFFEGGSLSEFKKLLETLVIRGWRNVKRIGVVDSLATLIIRLKEKHTSFLVTQIESIKRVVLRQIIMQLNTPEEITRILSISTFPKHRLLVLSDWEWLEGLLTEVTDPNKRLGIVRLLRRLLPEDSTLSSRFIDIIHKDEFLFQNFGVMVQPIDLDSNEAVELRREFNLFQEPIVSNVSSYTNNTNVLEPVVDAMAELKKYEDGDASSYWKCIDYLSLSIEDGYTYDNSYILLLENLPGWPDLTDEEKGKIVTASLRYLNDFTDNDETWMDEDYFSKPQVAIYRALINVAVTSPASIENLPPLFWDRWINLIVYCSLYPVPTFTPEQEFILTKSYHANRTIFNVALERQLQRLMSLQKDSMGLKNLAVIVNEETATILLNSADTARCPKHYRQEIFELVSKTLPGFFDKYAFGQYKNLSKKATESEVSSVVEVLSYSVHHLNSGSWPMIWKLLQTNISLGIRLFNALLRRFYFDEIEMLKRLTTQQRGDLLIWLQTNIPDKPAEKRKGSIAINSDQVQDYKRHLTKSLVEEGSRESIETLLRVAAALPENEYEWLIISAWEYTRKNTWTPPSVYEILTILTDAQFRLVRTGEELTTIIEESLVRLQGKLSGKNPTVFFLWDQLSKKKFKAKDENFLSDFVKMHLEYDLHDRNIVINREVEIRRSTGFGDGERTDILVEAVAEKTLPISLVIEVKKCHNPGIDTAMSSQLRNRYMSEFKIQHGLYLIGWFSGRFVRPLKKYPTVRSMKTIFQRQAQNLSKNGIIIRSHVLDCAFKN